MLKIPGKGRSKDEVFERLEAFRKDDVDWRSGRTWAYVYDPGPQAEEVIKRAYMMYLSENGLDPTAFPSTLRLETELVAMAASHLKGDDEVVGNFTSGGTESIILAVKTARDYARARKPHIKEPEIVLPVTAHAAFQKAAHYLCIKPVLVPVDPQTFKADPNEIRKAITPNAIQLVGSAISYAHGVIDPIREIGQIALEHDLLLHVDACVGGFLLPYFRRLGAPVPDFEFNVPGVTSMSMDFHKYAFAAKGASVVLHRNKDLRQYQLFTCATWTGYTMINATIQSSKSAGPMAAAWAVLNFIGDDGYLEIARQVLDATQRIADGIEHIDGLRLLGRPAMNLVAFTSDTINVFHIIDEMKTRSWYVQPQLSFGGSKENIHLSINPASVKWVDAMLADLRQCVELAKGLSTAGGDDAMQQMLQQLDPTTLTEETLGQMLAMAGIQGTGLPQRMAAISGLLNTLPPAVAEKLLTVYFNDLFRYSKPS
ncbi:MAG: aspartate aminotransferase family protein [Deltaproteobacteria bacterium]|nr:aspartate aminotransferase family protein [Deltaproteobacteria bacterium]